jgi:hypothetical protein
MRTTTPASRLACARHAVSTLLAWEWPQDAAADWTPTPEAVADKTRALYSWVTVSAEEAQAAIDQVTARSAAAS